MDARLGRAPGFTVIDSETRETTYIDNGANAAASHGAGTGAAKSIAEAGVDVVVAPEIGPKAASVLEAAGVRLLVCPPGLLVEDAYASLQGGKLRERRPDAW